MPGERTGPVIPELTTLRNKTLVCRNCDALTTLERLPEGCVAYCPCCRSKLLTNPAGPPHAPLALMTGALILFLLANTYPLLVLKIGDNAQATTLTGTAVALWRSGMQPLAMLVWLSTVLAPGFVISASLYLLSALRLRRVLPGSRLLLKNIHGADIWGMIDVFLLGMLVALVKLSDSADLLFGAGFFAFIFAILFFTAASTRIDTHHWWDELDRIAGARR